FFFFSSRRRHTRWPRDWSSDVCSSDLDWLAGVPTRGNLPIETDRLDPRGRIQAVGKLTSVEVVAAPSSAEHGLAVAEEVIGGAQARLVEQGPRREATQRNGAVFRVPFESAEGRGSGTRLTAASGVGRRIENGIAKRELVNPGLEVRETE